MTLFKRFAFYTLLLTACITTATTTSLLQARPVHLHSARVDSLSTITNPQRVMLYEGSPGNWQEFILFRNAYDGRGLLIRREEYYEGTLTWVSTQQHNAHGHLTKTTSTSTTSADADTTTIAYTYDANNAIINAYMNYINLGKLIKKDYTIQYSGNTLSKVSLRIERETNFGVELDSHQTTYSSDQNNNIIGYDEAFKSMTWAIGPWLTTQRTATHTLGNHSRPFNFYQDHLSRNHQVLRPFTPTIHTFPYFIGTVGVIWNQLTQQFDSTRDSYDENTTERRGTIQIKRGTNWVNKISILRRIDSRGNLIEDRQTNHLDSTQNHWYLHSYQYDANNNLTELITEQRRPGSSSVWDRYVFSDFVTSTKPALVNKLNLHPNPASQTVSVGGLTQSTYFQLITVTGEVLQQGLASPTQPINLAGLRPGVYCFKTLGQALRLVIE